MKRLLSLLFAVVLALLSGAVPASPTVSEQVGEKIGSVVYDLAHKDEFSPFEQKTGPPSLALSTTQHTRPRWGISGLGNSSNNGCCASFVANLQYTLVPDFSLGSGTPTFTRATTRYCTDFSGTLNLINSGEPCFSGARRVANLVTYSENFVNAAWAVANSATKVGAAPVAAPNGSTAYQIHFGSTASAELYQTASGVPQNGVAVFSMYLQAVSSATTVGLQITDQGGVSTNVQVSVTTAWQRFSVTRTIANASGIAQVNVINNTGNNSGDVYVAQAQLENLTGAANQNPGDYVNTNVLSAPYHGAGVDGVQYFPYLNGNTVSSNIVTQATGAAINSSQSACAGGVTAGVVDANGPMGYMRETAYTQLLLYSNDQTNADWTATNVTTAANSTVAAPDGTTTGTLLTASAANGTVKQSITGTAAAYTYSVYVLRKTGTGTINISANGGTNYTACAVNTSTWTRCSDTRTLTATGYNQTIQIVTNGDAIYTWENNSGLGSVPYSVVGPSTTVSVTRNADVLTYPLATNFSDTAGTMYAQDNETSWANATGSVIGSATQGMMPISTNSGVQGYDGTNTNKGATGSPSGLVKMAVAWSGSSMSVLASGVAVTTGSYDGGWNLTTIGIGTSGNGTIRFVKIWPVPLSSPLLILETTDATDWLNPQNWMLAANDDIFRKAANQ